MKDPAKRLCAIMADRGINVNELAELSGVSPTTITNLRTGRTKTPNIDTARMIANALHVKTNNIWPNR